jgi:hypothetical protein
VVSRHGNDLDSYCLPYIDQRSIPCGVTKACACGLVVAVRSAKEEKHKVLLYPSADVDSVAQR